MNKTVAIIGAGLGGLSAAITLAHHGYQVKVFEKNCHPGGKLQKLMLGSYQFDFGPNTITMPHVFQQVLSDTGVDPNDYFSFIKLDTHTRNHFPNGSSFDMSSNREAIIGQLQELDPYAARKFDAFIRETKRIYQLANQQFFYRTFHSWTDYLSPQLANAFFRVRPFQSLHNFNKKFFKNEQLLKAFNRYATYIGSSPYLTPATFSLITYLELLDGVYFAKGGNQTIAAGFMRRAKELGVEFHFETEVNQIIVDKGVASGIKLSSDETIQTNYVVANGDLISSYQKLVKESERPSFSNKKINRLDPSISAFVILVGLNKRLPSLLHHQVYFSDDYDKEFYEIFEQNQYADDPTIYICNSSHTDKTVSPDGDNLFILVNAPALSRDGSLQADPLTYKEKIYQLLAKKGVSLKDHLVVEKVITPLNIAKDYSAYRGALYGLASNRMLDAFLRPSNRAMDIDQLFFCGGSTHPGGGSQMVTISGQNVAKSILKAGPSLHAGI